MGILDEVKSVATTIQKADNIELYSKILEIQSQAMDLIEENRELKNEIEDIKKKLETKQSITYNKQMYWVKKENELDGPFCTRCWDKEQKLIRLHKHDNGWGTVFMQCPECSTGVETEKYKPNVSF